jgi:polyisoprenoid-binding protein YceI
MQEFRRRYALSIALALLLGTVFPQSIPAVSSRAPVALQISPTFSTVTFEVTKWSVLKQDGQFRKLAGEIDFDPADLTRARVDLTIDMKSLDTHDQTRDGVLLSDDFFDAAQYPTMTFKSVAIHPGAGPNLFDVAGDFTLHGITKRIKVPVTYLGLTDVPNAGQYAGFETEFTLDSHRVRGERNTLERRKAPDQQRSKGADSDRCNAQIKQTPTSPTDEPVYLDVIRKLGRDRDTYLAPIEQ